MNDAGSIPLKLSKVDSDPSGDLIWGSLFYEGVGAKDYTVAAEGFLRINDNRFLEGRDERYPQPVLGEADRIFRMTLSGGMMGSPYRTINGRVYPDSEVMMIKKGERVRLEYFNRSMMAHPVHPHGHFLNWREPAALPGSG